jgi:hypothetical protein
VTRISWMTTGLLCSLLGAACLSPAADTRATLPVLGPRDIDPAKGYEAPPTLRATELLPADVRLGPNHEVGEDVASDGFLHLYTVTSPYGTWEVASSALLLSRVRECEALGALEATRRHLEASQKMARGGTGATSGWELLSDPDETGRGVPRNAWEKMRASASVAGGDRSPEEDLAFKAFLGFETRKRELAGRLGVDPYSTNDVLQRELDEMAWASFKGGLGFQLVGFQAPAATGVVHPFATHDDRLEDLLANDGAEDLRRMNRVELAVMGVDEELREAFLDQPHLSPRHQTIIVASLLALEPTRDRTVLLETALASRGEVDALVMQRAAEMLRLLHERESPVTRLASDGRFVRAYLEDGRRVTPVEVDYLLWTRPTAKLADAGAAPDASAPDVRRELWLTGTASPLALREFEARGITVVENAFARLSPEPDTAGVAAPEASP